MEINGVEAPRYSFSLYLLIMSPTLLFLHTCTSSFHSSLESSSSLYRCPLSPPRFPSAISPVPLSIFLLLFLSLSIDRTLKMYIGGAQKRPDAPYARPVVNPSGKIVGQVSEGNRKDIREAVEAAYRAAPGYVTD